MATRQPTERRATKMIELTPEMIRLEHEATVQYRKQKEARLAYRQKRVLEGKEMLTREEYYIYQAWRW
jgi:hypothetical protein